MFNLEQTITNWRQQMRAAGIRSPQVLEELEGHLREEIEQQIKSGLDARTALERAAQEIGGPNRIQNEFQKIGSTARMLEWFMIIICAAFLGLITFLCATTVVRCFTSAGDRAMASVAMASTMGVAFAWRYTVAFLPMIASTWKRMVAGLACIVFSFAVGPFYADIILPHFVVAGDGSLPASGLWAVFIMAIFFSLGVGLCLNEKEREVLGVKRSLSTTPVVVG